MRHSFGTDEGTKLAPVRVSKLWRTWWVLFQRQSPVAGCAPVQSSPIHSRQQTPLFQPANCPDHGTATDAGPACNVGLRRSGGAVSRIAVQHQPNGDVASGELRQGEIDKGVEHGKAVARLPADVLSLRRPLVPLLQAG